MSTERLAALNGETLSRILDSVPQPFLVAGPDTRIVYVNPAAVSALGYDDESELLGLPSHDTIHPFRPDGSVYPAAECPMIAPARTGRAAHGDNEWFMRRDGTFRVAYWWSAPIDLDDRRGFIYSFFDLTERHAYEEAMRERDVARVRAAEFHVAQRRILESIDAVRRQTARDLQGGTQQRLTRLVAGVRGVQRLLPDGPAEVLELLDQSVGDAQEAVDDLKRLAAGIYPPTLTTRGLTVAVQFLAARSPVPARVTSNSQRRLPAAIESNAYFLISETLTNAVKHARATRIEITLRFGAVLEVAVADDGIGGIPDNFQGSGLLGMRDRVAAFGGDLSIDSPAGHGTKVVARIPIPETSNRGAPTAPAPGPSPATSANA